MNHLKSTWIQVFWVIGALVTGLGWSMLAIGLEAVARLIFETTVIFVFVVGGYQWLRWYILADGEADHEANDSSDLVNLWADRFRRWFAANNMLWGLLVLLIGAVTLTTFGSQIWVLALCSGVVTASFFAITGHWFKSRDPMMALCWRDQVPYLIRNPVIYLCMTFSIRKRLDHAMNVEMPLIHELVAALQNKRTGDTGSLSKVTNLKRVPLKEEMTHRGLASLPPALLAAALFYMAALLGILPERRYLSFGTGNGAFVLPGFLAQALGADKQPGVGNPDDAETGASQSAEGSGGEGGRGRNNTTGQGDLSGEGGGPGAGDRDGNGDAPSNESNGNSGRDGNSGQKGKQGVGSSPSNGTRENSGQGSHQTEPSQDGGQKEGKEGKGGKDQAERGKNAGGDQDQPEQNTSDDNSSQNETSAKKSDQAKDQAKDQGGDKDTPQDQTQGKSKPANGSKDPEKNQPGNASNQTGEGDTLGKDKEKSNDSKNDSDEPPVEEASTDGSRSSQDIKSQRSEEKGPNPSSEPDQSQEPQTQPPLGDSGNVIELEFPALKPSKTGADPQEHQFELKPTARSFERGVERNETQTAPNEPKQQLPPWMKALLSKDQ